MWFFVFLTFAIKIGQIWPFLFTNFVNYSIAHYSVGIELPKSDSAQDLQNKRYISFISIDQHGNYALGGVPIDFILLKKIIKDTRECIDNISLPDYPSKYSISIVWGSNNNFALIVDKNCEMKYVNKLFDILRNNKFYQVIFITKKAT